MKPANDVEQFFREAAVRTNPRMDEAVLDLVLAAHDKSTDHGSAVSGPGMRSVTMRSPIVKLGVAAAVIAIAVLGLFEFLGKSSQSGVVWAEVAKRTEASRGVIYRNMSTRSKSGNDMSDTATVYLSATKSRHDSCVGNQVTRTIYCDFDAKTVVRVAHDMKRYSRETMSEGTLREQHGAWADPGRWVGEFLSRKYTKLGQKTIDGALCEGIETTDPTFGVATFPVDSLVARVWVNVESGYPVALEAEIVGDGGETRITGTLDQFQWDVELDPNLFEPNIPSDYEDMRNL